jgi:hypothetical protein
MYGCPFFGTPNPGLVTGMAWLENNRKSASNADT